MKGTIRPMILASQLRDAIEDGAWIEVECVGEPVRVGNTHRGDWTVHICQGEGDLVAEAVYVTGRDLAPRSFRTVAGLLSFCQELGAAKFSCPLISGTRGTWVFGTSRMAEGR